MKITLTGDALRLFEHFLQYGVTNRHELANAMYYDYPKIYTAFNIVATGL